MTEGEKSEGESSEGWVESFPLVGIGLTDLAKVLGAPQSSGINGHQAVSKQSSCCNLTLLVDL